MPTRKEQREKRYEQILAAALDLFIRRGYAATKITDIAQAAGMSTGLLFNYFPSKAHLFTELIRLGVDAPEDMLNSLAGNSPMSFFEKCAEQTLFFAAQSEFAAKMFVLMGQAYYSEGIPEEARAMAITANFYVQMVPLIEAGQQRGEIRAGDPLALGTAFWTALQGAIEAHALTPALPLPQSEWIIDILRAKELSSSDKQPTRKETLI